jgi:tripartite-type tricarboxylate transporter receptor subunit TctC
MVSRIARAQAYPSRPVRIIVAAPAAGATDISARLIGQWLSERLGQPFVIDNRPGGNNNIGTLAAVRAPGDGYTLFLATVQMRLMPPSMNGSATTSFVTSPRSHALPRRRLS